LVLYFIKQFLVAALYGAEVGRLNPFAVLLRLCPVPIAVLTVYNEVNVLLYREILEISVAVEGYAITHEPLDVLDRSDRDRSFY
jgi:hypothetical protein